MLCQILIQAGYQANLQDHLAQTLEGLENNAVAGVCCAARVLNEFVAWLGYSFVHPDERPQSKMNPGAPLLRLHPQSPVTLLLFFRQYRFQ
ncbi:hypothetical protein UA45_04545 [Morganella morganii]|uniref:Uncharacterized protein n=1 Tax=Morganella morganii TaxID=582 RepID=A0A0D8LA81_MORMO|nr:hypothetical protein UA45_04545 [Morganella morganii]